MNRIDSNTIAEYQKILAADPNSKVFAVLADGYRELAMIEQGETLARRGIAKHPSYAPGYVVLGRILTQKKEYDQALVVLQKAIELSPDNLLAYQLLGEVQLQKKNPKEALKAHKMALFLSPQNERSKQVVKKLETLTADEFADDLFEMKPLTKLNPIVVAYDKKPTPPEHLERSLSAIDALIVRQEALLAREKLITLQQKYVGNVEIQTRLEMLDADYEMEEAESIKPLAYREKAVIEHKIQKLEVVLKALQNISLK